MRISDWSSDVCSSDLFGQFFVPSPARQDKEFGQRRVAHDISCGSIGGTKSSRGEQRPGRRHDATNTIIATTAGATTPARTITAAGRTTPMTKTIALRCSPLAGKPVSDRKETAQQIPR